MKLSEAQARALVPHVRAAIETLQRDFDANLTCDAILEVLGLDNLPCLRGVLESAVADIAPIDAATAVTGTFVRQLFHPLHPTPTEAETNAADAEWARQQRQRREDCSGTSMEY